MNRMKWMAVATLMLCINVAYAMDGTFDRSTEVKKYLGLLDSEYPATVVQAAKDISISGIADPALGTALSDKLVNAAKKLGTKRDEVNSAAWLTKALASLGIEDYAQTLETIAKQTRVPKLRAVCEEQIKLISWHKGKNDAMASRRDYQEGDNPRTIMLLNLLKTDDYSYKRFGVYRANIEKILDPRLMDEINTQINRYVDQGIKTDETANDAVKHFMRFLGYSQKVEHRRMIERVASSHMDRKVVEYAKKVLRNHGSAAELAEEADTEKT